MCTTGDAITVVKPSSTMGRLAVLAFVMERKFCRSGLEMILCFLLRLFTAFVELI